MRLDLGQRDTIARLLQTGVTRSAERLSKMSRCEWGIMSSSVNEIQAVRLLSWFHRAKGKHIGALLHARKDFPLDLLVLFSDKSARSVTKAVIKDYAHRLGKLPDLVPLTIGEVSNIMGQGMISALADHFGRTVILSVADVDTGGKSELVSRAFEHYDGRRDVLLMSFVEFYSENLEANCNLVIIVNGATLESLFKKRPSR